MCVSRLLGKVLVYSGKQTVTWLIRTPPVELGLINLKFKLSFSSIFRVNGWIWNFILRIAQLTFQKGITMGVLLL